MITYSFPISHVLFFFILHLYNILTDMVITFWKVWRWCGCLLVPSVGVKSTLIDSYQVYVTYRQKVTWWYSTLSNMVRQINNITTNDIIKTLHHHIYYTTAISRHNLGNCSIQIRHFILYRRAVIGKWWTVFTLFSLFRCWCRTTTAYPSRLHKNVCINTTLLLAEFTTLI